ncbi:unnamed protein product [Ectocarpus sp. 13 AM-2016]
MGRGMHQHEKTKRDICHIACQYEQVLRTPPMRGVDCGMVWRSLEHSRARFLCPFGMSTAGAGFVTSAKFPGTSQKEGHRTSEGPALKTRLLHNQAVGTDRYVLRELSTPSTKQSIEISLLPLLREHRALNSLRRVVP